MKRNRAGRSPTTSAAEAAASRSQPLQVGNWLLEQPLGAGALATVYAARPSQSPGAPLAYAVKLLSPRWQDEPRAVALLRREALVGRTVSHPNLVPVLAAHTQEPPHFLVMPLLEGQSLAARMRSDWSPPLAVALWIGRQLAEAIAALAEAGWIHGDIKPANVLLSPRGHATLIDLGFARRPDEERCAADRPVLGTTSYMAPEVFSSRLQADERSDLYSLGVTLYELLAGRLPFPGESAEQVVACQRGVAPTSLRSIASNVPAAAAELIHALLAKEPLRRPQTAREVADRLASLEIETLLDGRLSSSPTTATPRATSGAVRGPHLQEAANLAGYDGSFAPR
ncbi:MAG: serine/threonine protein kinase [Pirellulales bacterium]|nr:serine/threonine protein kinase [Pirellulales bacterium]